MPFECLINCSIYSRIIDVTGYDWLCFVDAWVVLISTVFVVPLRNRFEVGKSHSGKELAVLRFVGLDSLISALPLLAFASMTGV